MMTGKLQITMQSDWHIGSGTGRPGNIDRLIQRDTNHLPYIPAKTLTGIWRDGCELVAQGLDADRSGQPWQQWVNWLFGDQQPAEDANRVLETAPQTATLAVRSAHFPEALQNAFRGNDSRDNVMLQSMNTFIKPGVKINPRTGSALTDCLRFEEMARAGAILEADYALDLENLSTDQQEIAKALLVAGALMVERLGAKRRRGAGRCQITVTQLLEENQAIATLEKTQGQPPSPPSRSELEQTGTLTVGDRADSGWWRIKLEVTTRSPVIIHQRTVGNHQETCDYIPGTYFLPIILKSLRAYCNAAIDNALMHGDVVITNANRVVDGVRGEAIPFSLFEPKAKTASATIRQHLGKAITENQTDEPQLKGMRRGYVALQEKTLHRVTVNSEIAAHNTIADQKQRPDSEVGGIYTYAAIPAGLPFQLEVRIRDYLVVKSAVDPLANFLSSGTLIQIGRTKKDDYGNVEIKQISSEKMAHKVQTQNQLLTVWLLSDLLLRDERLRPTVDLQVFTSQLETQLGENVSLTLLEFAQDELPKIEQMVAFARSRRTESWQTKWGLPRPSLVGLSAGTILQFSVTGNLDLEQIKALEIAGLGERTAEGYGQLCFNSALLMQENLQPAQAKSRERNATTNTPILVAEDAPSYEYAKLVERETWREIMRRTAGAIAADLESSSILKPLAPKHSNLTASKLSTLRTLIDSLNSRKDTERILKVINRMEAKEAWKGATLSCVKQLIQNQETVWQCYLIDFSQYRLTQDAEAIIEGELWVEAVRILVDACVRAHKRASEQSNRQEQANG